MAFDLQNKRIFVAGHRGMVGQALIRRLAQEPCEVLTVGRDRLDLTRQADVEDWMAQSRPDAVILAAAKVGGIDANSRFPVDFLYDNLMIEANVIRAAAAAGIDRLLFLGSSCIYPKHADQPIREEALLTGPLEPTNEWYAVAKIAGIKLCQAYRQQYGLDFVSAQPTNLYGPGDNYDLETSHVLPALLRKFHDAKERGEQRVVLWGTGAPLREFLHVDDLADALVFLLQHYADPIPINIGSGEEVSIRELADLIAEIVGYRADLTFDESKPDGTPRKRLDTSRLTALGWSHARSLRAGIADTYKAFLHGSGAAAPQTAGH